MKKPTIIKSLVAGSLFFASACSSSSSSSNDVEIEETNNLDPIPGNPPKDSVGSVIVLQSPSAGDTDIDGATIFSVLLDTSTPYLSEQDAYKFVSEINQYISFGNYELEVVDYVVHSREIELDFRLANTPTLENSSYNLEFQHPGSGKLYNYEMRRESKLHLQGVTFDKVFNGNGKTIATVLLSEPVLLNNTNQICIDNKCVSPNYVGKTNISFDIGINVNPEDPITLTILSSLKSEISGENISVLPWQINNPSYDRINNSTSDTVVNYIYGFGEWDCGRERYCWGSFR